MALYDPVNGVYRKVSKKYDPVNGVYRKVKAAYDPVDGVYRQYFSGATPVSTLAVGDSVWMNVNGSLTEFFVVHQGNPDSAKYDSSCDGTWLLMKDLYTTLRSWNGQGNIYSMSTIHKYLTDTFLPLFDTDVQSIIKQVKIPYNAMSGADGLSTKLFLLSAHEVGNTSSAIYGSVDGARLHYFRYCNNITDEYDERIAYRNGTAYEWWLRTPSKSDGYTLYITADGKYSTSHPANMRGVRPAFILDSNTPIAQSDGKNIIE